MIEEKIFTWCVAVEARQQSLIIESEHDELEAAMVEAKRELRPGEKIQSMRLVFSRTRDYRTWAVHLR